MSWTRYKFERTRLPNYMSLDEKLKPESQLKAEQRAKRSRGFFVKQEGNNGNNSNNEVTVTTASNSANSANNLSNPQETRRARPELTEQLKQVNRKKREEEGGFGLDDMDSDDGDSEMSSNEGNDSFSSNGKDKKSKLSKWEVRNGGTAELKCPTCRNGGKPLNDPKHGRTVCIECGLVLEVGFISDQSEWRNFADSDKSGPDPNRVGSAGHYLLSDIDDLSTAVGDGSYLANLQKSNTNVNASTKLIQAIKNFERQGKELGLLKDTQNCAGEIFKDLLDCDDLKAKKAKSKQALSMYLASKMCGSPRPFKEICRIFNVDPKTVRKLHNEIFKLISAKKLNLAKHRKNNERANGRSSIHDKSQSTVEVYALRYASKLQLDKRKINKLLTAIVHNVENKFDFAKNRQPTSMAAACVFFAAMMVADNEKQQRSYNEVSAASNVSAATLQSIYRNQLHPNRTKLIPNFADQLRAQNLPLK